MGMSERGYNLLIVNDMQLSALSVVYSNKQLLTAVIMRPILEQFSTFPTIKWLILIDV